MNFNFFMPTKIYFGRNCLAENSGEFSRWGAKALLITGRNSAKESGALQDVVHVLNSQGITWELFDRIEENPSLELVTEAALFAREFVPDMIVAIGGGSPLDAAKAVAVLAVNNMEPALLYEGIFENEPLPVIALPLTAGTGSEVTPYSVLTDHECQTKRSVNHPDIFPKAAFLDARYTMSQPRHVTLNTAIDALSHAIEGYVSKRSNPVTDCLALQAIRAFGTVVPALAAGDLDINQREKLLEASLLAGVVIAQTATTVVHALGYSLTYFRHIPHGRANGMLLAEYLRFNQSTVPGKTEQILQALGLDTIEQFRELMNKLLPNPEIFTAAEVQDFAKIALQARNIVNTPRMLKLEDLVEILTKSVRLM